jgi:hypothetical protein
MATVAKVLLSGSTDGRQIKVVATATAGTTVHTADATNDGSVLDEVWLWAVNSDTTNRKLTIEFGGTSAPDDLIEVTIPAVSGYVLVVPGLCIENSVVVRAFAASANVILINGYVNRITN